MSGKSGKDFKYSFKFTTTPLKGPDYEETKAVLGEWKDYSSYSDPDLLDAIDKWQAEQPVRKCGMRNTSQGVEGVVFPERLSVAKARATDKLIQRAKPQPPALQLGFCCDWSLLASLQQLLGL